MTTEKLFQKLVINNDKIPTVPRLSSVIEYCVLKEVGKKVFKTLISHMMECEPDSNHIFTLVKLIVNSYCKIRMHQLAKEVNAKLTGHYIRKTYANLFFLKTNNFP